MANRDHWQSPDAAVLTNALEKLRQRGGATEVRLLRNGGADALLRLPAIADVAATYGIDQREAALRVVKDCVAELPDVTHRIVADAILGLGVLSATYEREQVDDRIIQALRSDALGRRRTVLLSSWRRLHEVFGVTGAQAPSDRTLRGTVESEVLRALANQLLRRTTTTSADQPTHQEIANPADAPQVIVVGAAVMDAIFRTRVIPQYETSTPAQGFAWSPGGKGLSQAIAAARLGLDVALIAPVADDAFSQEIVKHLTDQRVGTNLLRQIPHSATPVTGVFELPLGDSIAAYWRNEQQIRLAVRDVDDRADQIAGCELLLISFEIPPETFDRTLEIARGGRGGPTVIVTPGQPYPEGGPSRHSLGRIDYLVAHTWELERLAPTGGERFDPDRVSDHLLQRGVKNICLLGNGGGTVYSQTDVPRRLPMLTSHFKESSTTRDAFCAALAAKLSEGKTLTPAVAKWVMASMACAAEDYSHATTMPDRGRIERKLRELKSQNRRWAD